jgi:PhnB protein
VFHFRQADLRAVSLSNSPSAIFLPYFIVPKRMQENLQQLMEERSDRNSCKKRRDQSLGVFFCPGIMRDQRPFSSNRIAAFPSLFEVQPPIGDTSSHVANNDLPNATQGEMGMAQILAYLAFAGTCAEAMAFYKECLGAELKIMTVGESPVASQMPKESHSKVMHALLSKGDMGLMASDNLDGLPVTKGNAVSLMLNCQSEEEIRSAYSALSRGGSVTTELRKEFWGSLYADVTDRFGMRWMLNFDLK